jgi:hypothetical protein
MPRRPHSASGTSKQHETKTLKSSHGGFGGRTLIQRIEIQADKRRKSMEDLIIQRGTDTMGSADYSLQKGRYEGLLAALALLRSSSVAHEIERSNERLGIE